MTKRYDVIVIGAGPTGSTAANLLAQEGFSVLCLDRQVLGAELLVDTLTPALRRGTEECADLLDAHQRHMGVGYNVFATLIQNFYHSNLLHDLFFSRDQDPLLRRGLTSVLAGDLWRDDTPFQEKLMGSVRRRKILVDDACLLSRAEIVGAPAI